MQHIDAQALEELKEVMEDEFSMLIETYLSDGVVRIEEIEGAVKSGVADDIRRAAHSFKGSSANIGTLVLSQLCKELEDNAKNDQLSDSFDYVGKIKQEFETVKELLIAF